MATRRPTESPNKAQASPPAQGLQPAKGLQPAQPSPPAQAAPVRPEPAKTATPKPKTAARKKGSERAKAAAPAAKPGVQIPEDARRGMIAEAAYLRAERRGFMPGNETEDWLAAEAEVDALLRAGPGGTSQ